MVQPLYKTVGKFLPPTHSTPRCLLKKNESICSQKYLYTNVHSSFMCNNPILEIQMSITRWIIHGDKKQIIGCLGTTERGKTVTGLPKGMKKLCGWWICIQSWWGDGFTGIFICPILPSTYFKCVVCQLHQTTNFIR